MGDKTAWRCQNCRMLVYNLDEFGYPAPGAPEWKFASKFWNRLCTLCFQLYHIAADSEYLKKAQLEWEKKHKIDDTPPTGWSLI